MINRLKPANIFNLNARGCHGSVAKKKRTVVDGQSQGAMTLRLTAEEAMQRRWKLNKNAESCKK